MNGCHPPLEEEAFLERISSLKLTVDPYIRSSAKNTGTMISLLYSSSTYMTSHAILYILKHENGVLLPYFMWKLPSPHYPALIVFKSVSEPLMQKNYIPLYNISGSSGMSLRNIFSWKNLFLKCHKNSCDDTSMESGQT